MAQKTSVDSETTTKAPLKYNPRTDAGMGFFPPLMRSWLHAIMVAYAVFRKWPITYEVAAAEMSEAMTHLHQIKNEYLEPLTEDTKKQHAELLSRMSKISRELDADLASLAKTEIDDKYSERLHELTNMIFALATALDFETLGLGPDVSDAGKEL